MTPRNLTLFSAIWCLLLSSAGWSENAQLIVANDTTDYTEWTDEERRQNIAIRNLQRTNAISTHLVLVNGAEPPHYHDKHDLTATVLSGNSILHLEGSDIRLSPGSVAIIPRGTFHWTENISAEGSIVFTSFSPAFDGKDRRIVELPVSNN